MIYLDNNATTMLDPAVLAAMLPYLGSHYGNPSSTHRFGQESRQAVEEARVQLASLLGCDPKEILFTSGGTESDNAALAGLLAARSPRSLVISTPIEHSAVREPVAALKKRGLEVELIPVTPAGLDLARLEHLLTSRAGDVAFASIMWANNETGSILDIAAAGTLCRHHNVPLHVDGVQAVGKIALHLHEMPIDLLSLSAHKFHGPKGVGALYLRRGVRWQPWQRGGPQERDRRGGTENVPGIVGLGAAAALAQQSLSDTTPARIAALRDRLQTGILASVPDTHVIAAEAPRVPNTTNIGFAGLEAEAILLLLSEQDICASAGAACSSGSLEPSPILRALGIPDPIAHGAVRWSLSRFTTESEIDTVLQLLPPLIKKLRATLPV